MGQKMEKVSTKKTKTRSGYQQESSIYGAKNCQGCPLGGVCFNGKNNRQVERNHELERHKHKIRENLLSDIGEYHRKKRTAGVEPVFGHIKHNQGFKGFYHRGKKSRIRVRITRFSS